MFTVIVVGSIEPFKAPGIIMLSLGKLICDFVLIISLKSGNSKSEESESTLRDGIVNCCSKDCSFNDVEMSIFERYSEMSTGIS